MASALKTVTSCPATLVASRGTQVGCSPFLTGRTSLQSLTCSRRICREEAHGRSRLQVVARRRRSMAQGYGKQQQPMQPPKIDAGDDDPKFVIFIKTKNVSIWYPLSLVSGGTTAKMMLNMMKFDLGKKMYEGTLTRNMGAVIYKDEKAIQNLAVRQFPMLKGASGFEYGYKLADPANPRAAMSGSNVIKIPPQEELKPALEKAKEFVDDKLSSLKNSFSGLMGQAKNE